MIKRNLNGKCEEDVRRTIEDLDAQITALQSQLAALTTNISANQSLTARQLSDISGLIGARSQAVIGQESSDPSLPGAVGGGTVTSVTAGDLSPLFTTTETPSPTPVISFAQVAQAANIVFAGPTGGGALNPTFRALVDADIPAQEVKTDDAFTKIIAGAPYANDGYVTLKDHAGNSVRVMTTA